MIEIKRILCPVDYAEQESDLIVMGAHGGGVAALGFGSTTNHVVREATCPVPTHATRSRGDAYADRPRTNGPTATSSARQNR
jgi:hypothetical protein